MREDEGRYHHRKHERAPRRPKETALTLTQFNKELKTQARMDTLELVNDIQAKLKAVEMSQEQWDAVHAGIVAGWMAGAQWALIASAERVSGMLPIVTDAAMRHLQQELINHDGEQ